ILYICRMGWKPALSKVYAATLAKRIGSWDSKAVELQERTFRKLLATGSRTAFGKDHGLTDSCSYEEFSRRVPVRDYEALRPYIDRVVAGEPDVLWKGKPLYLAKTSGTTSGVKYIPLTR